MVAIKINGGSAGIKASVSASGAVTATLDSIANVRSCAWTISATDEGTVAASYTLTQSGSVGQNVATTALAAGTAATLRVVVNGGLSSVTGDPDSAATTAECKFYVPTTLGYEVLVAGELAPEVVVSSPTHGAVAVVNAAIRVMTADADKVTAAAAGTANDVPVLDATGKVLSRSLATLTDAGDGVSPKLAPRTDGASAVVAGADSAGGNGGALFLAGGASLAAGTGGKVLLSGGPSVAGDEQGVFIHYKKDDVLPSLNGAKRTVVVKNITTEPSAATPTTEAQWYPVGGRFCEFGADNVGGLSRPYLKGPRTSTAGKVLTSGNTTGSVADESTVTADGSGTLTATTLVGTTALKLGASGYATAGDVRIAKSGSFYGVSNGGADRALLTWATGGGGDTVTLGSASTEFARVLASSSVMLLGGELVVTASEIQVSVDISSSATFTGTVYTATQNALGSSTAAGVKLVNTTAATSSQQQVSPASHLEGRVWDGAASRVVETERFLIPLEAAIAPGGVATAVESVQTRMNAGPWVELVRHAAPSLSLLAPDYWWHPGVGETAAAGRVSNVANQGSAGGNVVQNTAGNKWLQTTWRGQPAWYLDGARYMVSDAAASAFAFLNNGSGSTVIAFFHLFTENAQTYKYIVDTGHVAGGAAKGFGLWNNGTHAAGMKLEARTLKTGITTVKAHASQANQGPGTALCIYRSKTGSTTPNESTFYVNGVTGMSTYTAAAASEDPDYTLAVGAGGDGSHTYKMTGILGPVLLLDRCITDLEIATIVEPYFIHCWGYAPYSGAA